MTKDEQSTIAQQTRRQKAMLGRQCTHIQMFIGTIELCRMSDPVV
jgi:hypothetical protein